MKTTKIMNAAEVAAAAKNASANTQTEAKALAKERKSLLATITFLAKSESKEAAIWRDFWGIKQNANTKDRRALVAKIEASYMHYATVCHVESIDDTVIVTPIRIVPCTAKGKEITDYLQVLKSAKIREEKRRGVMACLKAEARDENGNIKFDLLPRNVQAYLSEKRVYHGYIRE